LGCQVYALYSNAHRGKERKRGQVTSVPPILRPAPATRASPGWRELIKRVYEVDPLTCPSCGSEMKAIAFITNYEVIDRIIHHLRLTLVMSYTSCKSENGVTSRLRTTGSMKAPERRLHHEESSTERAT
jgi:hypothetical protein